MKNSLLESLCPDIWKIICRDLTKHDMIALQLYNNKISRILSNIPEIWWGKHNITYCKIFNEKFNNISLSDRDKNLKEKLKKCCHHNKNNVGANKIVNDIVDKYAISFPNRNYYRTADRYNNNVVYKDGLWYS